MDTPMLGSQPHRLRRDLFIVGGERAELDTITPYLDIMAAAHVRGASASGNRVSSCTTGWPR